VFNVVAVGSAILSERGHTEGGPVEQDSECSFTMKEYVVVDELPSASAPKVTGVARHQ
jgi:hypothetical protein